ncbi:MAG TPA: hypothetical protein VD887_08275 [Allosphingosinicella sp.]|nr:hypothetical protein [Allosphingosinicella sp.]
MRAPAYVALAVATAAAILGAVAALNLAMDPYSVGLGRWTRLRSAAHDDVADRVPDAGTAARAQAVARSSAPVLLLGTSRTQAGFRTDPGRIFNAGQSAATMDDVLRVAEAAAARPVPPAAILIELPQALALPPVRRRLVTRDWPGPTDRLLATSTTHVSLHLLGHASRGRSVVPARDDFFLDVVVPAALGRAGEGRAIAPTLPFVALGGAPRDHLPEALARLVRLCVRTGATILLYEPPLDPARLRSGADREAARARVATYRLYLRRVAQGGAGCPIALLDFSGLPGSLRIPEAEPAGAWIYRDHFRPAVGDILLRRMAVDDLLRS